MSIIKGIFKYAFILVMIAVGISVVCMAVMMIGGVSMFGYKYVSYSVVNGALSQSDNNPTSISLNPASEHYLGAFDSIVVDAPDMNVNIRNGHFKYVGVEGAINVKGFINTSDIDGYIVEDKLGPQIFKFNEPYVQDGVLYISVETVDGFLSYSKHDLNITIPAYKYDEELHDNKNNYSFTEGDQFVLKDITVNCEDGNFSMFVDNSAMIDLAESPLADKRVFPVRCSGTLSVTTTTGTQSISGVDVNNVVSVSERGDLTIGNLVNLDVRSASFMSDNDAEVFLSDKDRINGIRGTLNVQNKYGDIVLTEGTDVRGLCTINSDYSKVTLNNINPITEGHVGQIASSGLSYKGEGASLTMQDVYGVVSVDSQDAKMKINSIKLSDTVIIAELSVIDGKKFGLEINEIDGSTVNVVTESGAVKIGSLRSETSDITTKSGNVSIENLYSGIKVITNTGNITINQKESNDVVANTTVVDVKTDKGNVLLKDIYTVLKLKVTENASVKVSFSHIYANSTLQNGDGHMEIAVPYEKYVLKTSGNAEFDVKIAQVDYTNKNEPTTSFVSLMEEDVLIETEGEGENAIVTYKDTTDNNNVLNVLDIVSLHGDVTISNSVN